MRSSENNNTTKILVSKASLRLDPNFWPQHGSVVTYCTLTFRDRRIFVASRFYLKEAAQHIVLCFISLESSIRPPDSLRTNGVPSYDLQPYRWSESVPAGRWRRWSSVPWPFRWRGKKTVLPSAQVGIWGCCGPTRSPDSYPARRRLRWEGVRSVWGESDVRISCCIASVYSCLSQCESFHCTFGMASPTPTAASKSVRRLCDRLLVVVQDVGQLCTLWRWHMQ